MTQDTDTRLIERALREALIQCGRAAGALLADEVSNEFLMFVPGEVKARIESLIAEVAKWKSRALELETQFGDLKGVFVARTALGDHQ